MCPHLFKFPSNVKLMYFMCVYVHAPMCVWCPQGQKKVWDPLEPELLAVVSHLVGSRKNLGPLGEQPVLVSHLSKF